MDPVYNHVISLLLSWVFISAAWHKLRQPDRFKVVLDNYQLLPFPAHTFYAWIVGLMEAAIGIGLLLGNVRTTAVVAGMVVLTVYALAIGFNLLRGRSDIDCGCSGPGSQQPISWHLVVRNIFMVTLAGATLVAMPLRALVWIDWLTTICASLLAIVIYQGCGILLENQLKLNEMRRGT